jgi:hypothetical protein
MRRLPVATLAVVLATLAAYSVELAGGGLPLCQQFGVTPERLLRTGDVVPLLVYPLLHAPGTGHTSSATC